MEVVSRVSFTLDFREFCVDCPTLFHLNFSHLPSIYSVGQNRGLWLCVRGHLGKITIYSNAQANLLWPIWSLFFLMGREYVLKPMGARKGECTSKEK